MLHLASRPVCYFQCVEGRENAVPTDRRFDKSVSEPTSLECSFLSHSCTTSLACLVRVRWKEVILSCWIETVVKIVVCLICVCWLASHGLSVRTLRHIISGCTWYTLLGCTQWHRWSAEIIATEQFHCISLAAVWAESRWSTGHARVSAWTNQVSDILPQYGLGQAGIKTDCTSLQAQDCKFFCRYFLQGQLKSVWQWLTNKLYGGGDGQFVFIYNWPLLLWWRCLFPCFPGLWGKIWWSVPHACAFVCVCEVEFSLCTPIPLV